MRKFVVIIIALATLGFLAGVASAGKVSISGTHSREEIKATCDSVGGEYLEGRDIYGCWNGCGDVKAGCSVNCKDGKCEGQCPKCGRREGRLPVLGGADAVDRTLKNSVKGPSKP